jgi:hypothetical protein
MGIKQFIRDAGTLAVTSVLTAFAFYGIGIWEHFTDHPVSGFWLMAISLPLWWFGAYAAWNTKRKELDEIKRRPPSIKVYLKELHRKEIDFEGTYPGGEWRFDIFLRARVELEEPRKITVDTYKFELSMFGLPEIPELRNDLDEWQLLIFEPVSDGVGWTEHGLPVLPMELKSGEPAEGWLHFVTRKTRPQFLDQSIPRLIAQTPHGSQYGEHPADKLIWNPDKRRVSKK